MYQSLTVPLCHWTELKYPAVVGALLGQHNGRTIDVSNSFELVIHPTGQLDREFFLAKQTQCMLDAQARQQNDTVSATLHCATAPLRLGPAVRQVFPTLDVLGWYATSAAVTEDHIRLHNQVRA